MICHTSDKHYWPCRSAALGTLSPPASQVRSSCHSNIFRKSNSRMIATNQPSDQPSGPRLPATARLSALSQRTDQSITNSATHKSHSSRPLLEAFHGGCSAALSTHQTPHDRPPESPSYVARGFTDETCTRPTSQSGAHGPVLP